MKKRKDIKRAIQNHKTMNKKSDKALQWYKKDKQLSDFKMNTSNKSSIPFCACVCFFFSVHEILSDSWIFHTLSLSILHRKVKIELHEPDRKPRVNSGALEG